MALSEETKQRISSIVGGHDVVLFIKGDRQMPQCGFSGRVVQILDSLLPEYETVDVLSDPEIREGIKEYSSWPTIPQLYVKGEFVGGCDIVNDLYATGELHKLLGVNLPEAKTPSIRISEAAARRMREYAQRAPDATLHLSIDARFQSSLGLGPRQGNEIEVEANGVTLLMDPITAQRADGLSIDFIESPTGSGLRIDNPNAPH
jgi:monothiol glutaredoxin